MALTLHPDFREFLKLLNSKKVKYLLIGGHAIGFHGYPRTTADLDIWISTDFENARKVLMVIQEFGFNLPELSPELF